MTDPGARSRRPVWRSCPACGPGGALARVAAWPERGLRLERCERCGGAVAHREAIALVPERLHPSHPLLVERARPDRCRACAARVAPGLARCPACAASLSLACPGCGGAMTLLRVADTSVDACRACEIAFFDRGELGRIARDPEAFARALRPGGAYGSALAAEAVAEAIAWAPDAEILAVGAHAAGEVALDAAASAASAASEVAHAAAELGAAGAVEATGEVALEAAEAVAEASSSVAEGLLELLSAVFD